MFEIDNETGKRRLKTGEELMTELGLSDEYHTIADIIGDDEFGFETTTDLWIAGEGGFSDEERVAFLLIDAGFCALSDEGNNVLRSVAYEETNKLLWNLLEQKADDE